LDQLLAGQPLAKKTMAEAEQKEKEEREAAQAATFGVQSVWSIPGQWQGVDVDMDSATVQATSLDRQLMTVQADGSASEPTSIPQAGIVRLANLSDGEEPELLTFRAWGSTVQALEPSGKELWDYSLGEGVDDVFPADLDGDGRDEVIIGYNGGTGVHLLDHEGQLLWKFTEIGNVWHVTAGDFDGAPGSEVITTSASGAVHVFDSEGTKIKDIRVPMYANMVRMVPPRGASQPSVLVTGSADDGEKLVTIDYAGKVLLDLDLPGSAEGHVDDAAVAATMPWAAIAMRGGTVHVVDLDKGAVIATAAGQGSSRCNVAWCPRADKSPLLVIATGEALNALEIGASGGEN
jgi:hypothetical protein